MASQRFRPAASTYLPVLLLLLFVLGAFLFGQNNLWSLQHLWRTFDQPLGQNLFPAAENNAPPASHTSARIWQAEQKLANGDAESAAQIVAADVAANNKRALRLQGKILEAQGNVDQALETWLQLGDVHSLLQAGEKFSADEQLTDAMRALQAAHEIDPDEGTYRFAYFLWRKLDDHSRAEEVLVNSIGAYTRSSHRAQWLIELGDLYVSQERWGDALGVYKAARDIDSDRIAIHMQLGRLHYQAYGDVDQAMVHFRDVIAIDEQRGYGHFEIANMLRKEKRHADAMQWYATAAERESQNPAYQYTQAINMVESGNRIQGVQLFEKTAKLFPEYAPTFYQLSVHYKENGLLSEAKSAIENAIALSKPNVPAYIIRQAEAIDKALLP